MPIIGIQNMTFPCRGLHKCTFCFKCTNTILHHNRHKADLVYFLTYNRIYTQFGAQAICVHRLRYIQEHRTQHHTLVLLYYTCTYSWTKTQCMVPNQTTHNAHIHNTSKTKHVQRLGKRQHTHTPTQCTPQYAAPDRLKWKEKEFAI